VLSPSEGAIDLRHKVRDYLRGGSREVWLLDHSNGEVQVNTSSGIRVLEASDVLDSPLLPGFGVKVADLIAA
jgi:Uma2 family endonuclease